MYNKYIRAELWCHVGLQEQTLLRLHNCTIEIFILERNSIKSKENVLQFVFALECLGRDQADTILQFMFVNFILHSTTAEALSAFTFSRLLAYISHVLQVFPHFPATRTIRTRYEVAEHSEIFRTKSTISWCSAVHLTRLKSRWFALIFRGRDNKKKNQTAELCKKI